MKLTMELAALRARAALGRPPLDKFEASVVLESWGLSQSMALPVAGAGQAAPPPTALDRWSAMATEEEGESYLDILGLIAGLLAATLWAAPLVANLGGAAFSAWRWALPATYFLQWLVRRRYFSRFEKRRRDRLSGLRSERTAPAIAVIVAISLAVAVIRTPWLGAALTLMVIWTGGLFLVRRGWAPLYVGLLLAGTVAFAAHIPVPVDVLVEGEAVLAAVVVAVATSHQSQRWPRPWREAVPSGLVGLSLGILIVAFWFPVSADGLRLLAVAMLPPLLGSLAWFWVLTHFWRESWIDFATTEVHSPNRSRLSRTARWLNAGALLGYLLVTAPLAMAGIEAVRIFGIARGNPTLVFLDLGLIGLASAMLAWLEALRQAALALGVAIGSLIAGLVTLHVVANVATVYPEFVMAISASLLAAGALWLLHSEPDRLVAQML
jgi:hypothetical protein